LELEYGGIHKYWTYTITKCVHVHQVIALDFEWIHWLQWTRPSGDVVNFISLTNKD
jgi:hypothetical protein